jgi:hypothetical protein
MVRAEGLPLRGFTDLLILSSVVGFVEFHVVAERGRPQAVDIIFAGKRKSASEGNSSTFHVRLSHTTLRRRGKPTV